MELIPFDINADFEKWEPIYRCGERPDEWHYFNTCIENEFPLVSISEGMKRGHVSSGRYFNSATEHSYDLFLTPKVKKMYTNIYNDISGGFRGSIKECIENKGTECLGTIEVSIHDNKLIDVKIVEG